jgi:UDPglucose 6-dehydrogenase
MKTAVIGVGHVGLVTVATLARWGHDVIGFDHDTERIAALQAGEMPFFEPGLAELVDEGVEAGRIAYTASEVEAFADVDVAFICVGTPSKPDGSPNLTYVEAVARSAARNAGRDIVLVEKSTVPASTGDRIDRIIEFEARDRGIRIEVASNPEFLREGTAVEDTLHPDRIVVGVSSDWAADRLREIYAPVVEEDGCPYVETDRPTAELIKHASNAFLATRISFINVIAEICEKVGADVQLVADGMGHDARIGRRFLHAGLGYGGSCFPKDVDAFAHLARQVGVDFSLLEDVRAVNQRMRAHVLTKLTEELWHLDDKTVTILGMSFKPGTDDLREAPAMWLAEQLLAAGATVRVYDPVALDHVTAALPDVVAVHDPLGACDGAHAAVVATEWQEVRALDLDDVAKRLAWPVLIDGRNVFDADRAEAAGLRYRCIGRREADGDRGSLGMA